MAVLRVVKDWDIRFIIGGSADDSSTWKVNDIGGVDEVPASCSIGLITILPSALEGQFTGHSYAKLFKHPIRECFVSPKVVMVDVDSSIDWGDDTEGSKTVIFGFGYVGCDFVVPNAAAEHR